MSIFNKLRRNGNKEFLKYEDGKIIPVKIEGHKNYEELTISPLQQEDKNVKEIIKEKIDMPGKVKKYGTFKTLKIAGAIVIVLFFGYTVKDVYLAFSKDTPVNEQPPTTDVDKPSQDVSGGSNVTPPDTLTPPVDDDKENNGNDSETNVTGSTLKQAIDTTIVINNMIVSELEKENNLFSSYSNNRLNRISFEKKINESMTTKNQLIAYLTERKDFFKEEDIKMFYDATERRLKHSILLSETLLDSLVNSTSDEEVSRKINLIMEKDAEYKDKQTEAFIDVLKSKGVDYTYDEINQEIKYNLK